MLMMIADAAAAAARAMLEKACFAFEKRLFSSFLCLLLLFYDGNNEREKGGR